MYFVHVQGLAELEEQDNWEACRKLLVTMLQDDPQNIQLLCRLIAECWYILVMRNSIFIRQDVSFPVMFNTLNDAVKYGLEHFTNNTDFLWQTGYMMAMFPMYFSKINGHVGAEQLGREMIKKAAKLCPNDTVIQVLAMGFEMSFKQLLAVKREMNLETALSSLLSNETAIERYFREIIMYTE